MTKYLYSARILPICRPVVIPDVKGGGREPQTFTEDSLRIERESRNPGKVLLDHDVLKRIGEVQTLWRHEGWFVADFTLDPELTAELHVGQPVSVGLSLFHSGSRYLSEVSIVRRGAVDGAEITRRVELKAAPPPRALTLEESRELEERVRRLGMRCPPGTLARPPSLDAARGRTKARPPEPVGEVFHGAEIIRRNIGQVLRVR